MELHLAQMEDLIDQLLSLGETLAEHLTVALFLSSLPDSYGTLITALETRDEADLTRYIRLLKSQVTHRTCLQSKYRLYEIRPTGPARRLATR